MLVLGPLIGLLILFLVGISITDAVAHPTIRRLAFRNIARRRGEAFLVVIGSLLGTAIITASFIMGGTVGASIKDFGRTELGPADEVVSVRDLAVLPKLEAALSQPIEGTDGTLSIVTSGAAVATTGATPRAEPTTLMMEVDFDKARAFGGNAHATGFAGTARTPAKGEIVLGKDLAERLKTGVGQTVSVYAYGQRSDLRVTALLPKLGVAGYGGRLQSAFVAPGTIASLFAKSTVAAARPPDGSVLVSNEGGVFSGAELTDAVAPRVRERVKDVPGADVQLAKQELLHQAKLQGQSLQQLFGGIGTFSVIAGILLLVNIFVMLSEERKSELGMLRAVGLKRNQLVRTFGLEGGIYAVVSAVVGALVGVAVGRGIVWAAQSAFSSGDERNALHLRFTVSPGNIIGGMVIGGVIAFITVWGTSFRIGRLNVISAIRDLQDTPSRRANALTLIIGAFGVVLGGSLLMNGVRNDGWFGALAGVPIAAFSSIPLLTRLLPRRVVVTAACGTALVWGVLCFTLLPDAFSAADVPTFVVQGVILVAAGVTLLATNADLLIKTTSWLSASGRTLAARLAFAYPLARRFRTSMLLGMYAIVIFTMTFISVFSNLFSQQSPKRAREAGGGYTIQVTSNPANPVAASTLAKEPGVVAVAPLLQGFTDFSASFHPKPVISGVTGFDQQLLARDLPKVSKHLSRFPTARATWDAVLHSDDLAIVSDFFLQDEGGPPQQLIKPGQRFTIYNRATGAQREMTVAGILSTDVGGFRGGGSGVLMGAPFVSSFMGRDAVPSRFYVASTGDADDIAAQLQGRLLTNGVEADSFLSLVKEQAQQQQGFFRLMEGYLGLGLVIGIAGLGVVMVRAVRERRRQIGMLRAMGFPHRVVRTAFLLEATFIAFQGVIVGVGLALITAYTLLTKSDSFGSEQLAFSIPWVNLAVVMVVSMVASVAAVLAPASQASRIKPAVALRIAD